MSFKILDSDDMPGDVKKALANAIMGGILHDKPQGANPQLPEAQIAELQQYFKEYINPPQFELGDIVYGREGRNMRYTDQPHIVIEVFDNPVRYDNGDWTSSGYYERLNVRIATMVNGAIVKFMANSVDYEKRETTAG